MADINIPPKAVEAAVRTHMNLNLATRERAMDAAIRAALAAWPGVKADDSLYYGSDFLILPLTEKTDD